MTLVILLLIFVLGYSFILWLAILWGVVSEWRTALIVLMLWPIMLAMLILKLIRKVIPIGKRSTYYRR